jgi:hypothetical protein
VLKNPFNFVLGSKPSSTYFRMYASGAFSPAALLKDLLSTLEEKKFVVR